MKYVQTEWLDQHAESRLYIHEEVDMSTLRMSSEVEPPIAFKNWLASARRSSQQRRAFFRSPRGNNSSSSEASPRSAPQSTDVTPRSADSPK